MLLRSIALSLVLILSASLTFAGPASQATQDAWPLYSQAIHRIAEWYRLETASYTFNAPARVLVREARTVKGT